MGRRIISRIFSPDFFSSFLWGKSAQKNPPGKCPGKSSKIYTTKILQHISADWPGQELSLCTSDEASCNASECIVPGDGAGNAVSMAWHKKVELSNATGEACGGQGEELTRNFDTMGDKKLLPTLTETLTSENKQKCQDLGFYSC